MSLIDQDRQRTISLLLDYENSLYDLFVSVYRFKQRIHKDLPSIRPILDAELQVAISALDSAYENIYKHNTKLNLNYEQE